jgi:nucleolar protein 15
MPKAVGKRKAHRLEEATEAPAADVTPMSVFDEAEGDDLSDGGDDNDDDDESDDAENAAVVASLNTAPAVKAAQTKARKIEHDGRSQSVVDTTGRGVVYVGHIPFGFYERPMRDFFSQFGTVTRLRLSRSRRTGRSRGYAFIELQFRKVAELVVGAMNNYLLFDRTLKCELLESDKVHAQMFDGANRRGHSQPRKGRERHRHNRERDEAELSTLHGRHDRADKRKRARLAAAGIDYSFPGDDASPSTTSTTKAKAPTAKRAKATPKAAPASKPSAAAVNAAPAKRSKRSAVVKK